MSKNKNYHVTPHPDGGWQVKRDNAEKASSKHKTQSDAIDQGREFAIKNKTELVIHRKNGVIRDSDSYGNDPFPPKDRKH